MEKDHFEKLTVIIPTYNRTELLSRLLSYYANKTNRLKFIVLDSSAEEFKKTNKIASSILKDKIRYIEFPLSTVFADKLLTGLKYVDTPFCVFCPDDDIIFLEGLSQALLFLHNNEDYVCADGIYLNFNPIEQDVYINIEYATQGIDNEEFGARIFTLYQKYESLFYAVYRTKQAVEIFSTVNRNESLHYQELFQATAAMIMGKSRRLPIFYAARRQGAAADPGRDKWQTQYWFVENPEEFLRHYIKYRNELWSFYQKMNYNENYSEKDFFKIIDVTHAMFFSTGCDQNYFYSVLKNYWKNHSFNNINKFQVDVSQHFKNKNFVYKFLKKYYFWIDNKKKLLYFFNIKKMENSIKKSTNLNWKCKLNTNLLWLVRSKIFSDAFFEICKYLSISFSKCDNKG